MNILVELSFNEIKLMSYTEYDEKPLVVNVVIDSRLIISEIYNISNIDYDVKQELIWDKKYLILLILRSLEMYGEINKLQYLDVNNELHIQFDNNKLIVNDDIEIIEYMKNLGIEVVFAWK